MNAGLIKRLATRLGNLLALAGLAFVAVRIAGYWEDGGLASLRADQYLGLAFLSGLAGLSVYLLVVAWRALLQFSGATIGRGEAISVYGISQIARYVPGNIFHLAGRQSLGLARGYPGWALARSTLWELGLISFAGATFSLLVLPEYLGMDVPEIAPILALVAILVVGILALSAVDAALMRAFAAHMFFLLCSGVMFLAVLMLVTGDSGSPVALTVGSFVVAWLLGFLFPGAPAGLGIREAVLVILLQGSVAEADLLLAALLSRLVTVVGDTSFFVFARAYDKRIGSG